MAQQYKREPLTEEEANRLVNACTTTAEKLVVWTILDTGLRASELASLTRQSVNWQTRPATLMVYGKGGPYGARSKRRVVPVSSRLRPILEHFFALQDAIGITRRTVHRIVKRVATRAGIARATMPHVLRHTFAVDSIRKGISLPALQRALGHDHLTSTEIYLNLHPDDVLREYAAKW